MFTVGSFTKKEVAFHSIIWRVGVVFCLLSVISLSNTIFAKSVEKEIFESPHYSILFDQLEVLEKKKKYIDALRLIPKIYAAEDIPVDAVYLSLNKKKNELLDVVFQGNISFRVGKRETTCADTSRLFTDLYIGKPELYKFFVPTSDDLEYKRFCYLLIAEGHLQQISSGSSLLLPSYSLFNLQSALDSSDPWLVSTALFFARKQKKSTISPLAVIDRWERRLDLWDDRCTQQAMLFIAQFDAEIVNKLQVSNEDIQMQLAELEAVPSDKSYFSPLLFISVGRQLPLYKSHSTGITLLRLEGRKGKEGVVKRWVGDKNQFSKLEKISEKEITADDYEKGVVLVELGLYKIQFNSMTGMPPSGYYGKSNVFEVHQGDYIVVPVSLIPTI